MTKNNELNAPNTVIQYTSTSTGAYIACTTALPNDDTIPQNDEGDEVLTLAITPKSATNILEINFGTNSTANAPYGAIFQDSTANALAASTLSNGGRGTIKYRMAAGTTSSTTFKVRVGDPAGGTVYINGSSVTTDRILGGVSSTILSITEYQG